MHKCTHEVSELLRKVTDTFLYIPTTHCSPYNNRGLCIFDLTVIM